MVDANEVRFDLEPFIREAAERVSVEVDRRLAPKVAAELEKLGWTCIPPVPMTDQIPAEAIEAAARAIQSAHVPVTGEAVPGWESESEAWRKTYRDFARAALEAVDPFLRPEPSEGFATCETCGVTFTGTGTGDRFEVEHMGDRRHRVRALIRVSEPSEDERADRIERGETA